MCRPDSLDGRLMDQRTVTSVNSSEVPVEQVTRAAHGGKILGVPDKTVFEAAKYLSDEALWEMPWSTEPCDVRAFGLLIWEVFFGACVSDSAAALRPPAVVSSAPVQGRGQRLSQRHRAAFRLWDRDGEVRIPASVKPTPSRYERSSSVCTHESLSLAPGR